MSPESVSITFCRLEEAGHWQRLLDRGLPLLATEPDSAVLRGLLGNAALQLDQHRTAKEHLTACLSLEPG